MEENNKSILITLCILMVAGLIMNLFTLANNNTEVTVDENAIALRVAESINIPSAEAIGQNVQVNMPDVVIPNISMPEVIMPKQDLDGDKLDDLWEDLHGEDIDELEDNAYDVVIDELENRDYKELEKFLEESIDGFYELENVNEDEDETEVTVIELGLDDDEDKEAEVYLEIKVKYTLIEGEDVTYKKIIKVNSNVIFEEGDFQDEEVTLTFE